MSNCTCTYMFASIAGLLAGQVERVEQVGCRPSMVDPIEVQWNASTIWLLPHCDECVQRPVTMLDGASGCEAVDGKPR